jgi:hypothetical protein
MTDYAVNSINLPEIYSSSLVVDGFSSPEVGYGVVSLTPTNPFIVSYENPPEVFSEACKVTALNLPEVFTAGLPASESSFPEAASCTSFTRLGDCNCSDTATYYMTGLDSVTLQHVYWHSTGIPDFTPVVTEPSLVGSLIGAFVIGRVLR